MLKTVKWMAVCVALGACSAAYAGSVKFEHELTLFALPAPRPVELSWASPGSLTRGVIANEAFGRLGIVNRKIGHAGLRVQCGATATRPAATFQGSMTNSVDAEFADIAIKKAYGLGLVFFGFQGRLETADELQKSLDQRYRNGRVAFVRIGLNADNCHRLIDYVREYERVGVQKIYGLVMRPLYREGAGCSAFSMSFLDVAGVIEPRFRAAWSFQVRVPMKYIGGPLGGGKRVNLAKIALTGRRWARANEPGLDLFGWDPTLMYHAITRWVDRARRGKSQDVWEYRGRAPGLVIDRRNVPAGTGSFWKN
jgi:hypothetical protein